MLKFRASKWMRTLCLCMAALSAVLAMQQPASACYNDQERIVAIESQVPEIDVIIAGGFARQSDEYYQSRIDTLAPALLATDAPKFFSPVDIPHYLRKFDDVAVAFDKLGKSDVALKWMERKFAEMERLEYSSSEQSAENHFYTYYANIGTIRVHRWLKQHFDDREDKAELDKAIGEIEQAIELYPDAHDGRERYQLLAMKWIRDLPKPEMQMVRWGGHRPLMPSIFPESFFELPEEGNEAANKAEMAAKLHDAAQGLAGLIALGNAWESVDVFYSLSRVLMALYRLDHDESYEASALFAAKRASDLAQDGARSIAVPFFESYELSNMIWGYHVESSDCDDLKLVPDLALRNSVIDWQEAREAYSKAQLAANISAADPKAFWADFEGDPWFYRHARTIRHQIIECEGKPGRRVIEEKFWVTAMLGALAFSSLSLAVVCLRIRRKTLRKREKRKQGPDPQGVARNVDELI